MTPSSVTWLVHVFVWDMTHSYVTWLSHVWHDPFRCNMMTLSCATRLIHFWYDSLLCDMTHSCIRMRHDSFIFDMIHFLLIWLPQVRHNWFLCDMIHTCVTWLIRASPTHSYRACIPTKNSAPAVFVSATHLLLLQSTRLLPAAIYLSSSLCLFFFNRPLLQICRSLLQLYRALLLRW